MVNDQLLAQDSVAGEMNNSEAFLNNGREFFQKGCNLKSIFLLT